MAAVRIERLELRVLRLPLVRFFETSFGRVYDRTFLLVRLDGGRRDGLGRMRRRRQPVLQLRDGRDGLAHHHGVPGAARARASTFAPSRATCSRRCAASAATTWRRPRSRWRRGICSRARQASRSPRCSAARARAIASGVSIGIQDSLEQLVERVGAELADGLPADQDQGEAGLGHRRRARRSGARFGDDPADGGRQRGLHAGGRGAPGGARRVRPDDDRAAARLRRHRAITRCCSGSIDDADLPRRVDPLGAPRARCDRRRRVPHHQHQARARGRPRASRSGCTTCARRAACRCGTAACSSRASAARTTCTCRRCRTSRCRATWPPASGTTSRT